MQVAPVISGRFFLHVCVSISFVLLTVAPVSSQPISSTATESQLADYFQERMVRISYKAKLRNGETKDVEGSGFFISANGYVLTALHVVEPIFNTEKYEPIKLAEVSIERANLNGAGVPEKLTIVANSDYQEIISKRTDIAIFQVKRQDDTVKSKYICLNLRHKLDAKTDKIDIPTWDKSSGDWVHQPRFGQPVILGDSIKYRGAFSTSFGFTESMSGSPIIFNGRAVGVIAYALVLNGEPVKGENFGIYLNAASDVGLDTTFLSTECESDWVEIAKLEERKTVQAFLADTCEGTVGWIDGRRKNLTRNEPIWSAEAPGNSYRLEYSALAPCNPNACKDPLQPDICKTNPRIRVVTLIVNHSEEKDCYRKAFVPVGTRTFFGMQVSPVFSDESYPPAVWIYRIGDLYRQDRSGPPKGSKAMRFESG